MGGGTIQGKGGNTAAGRGGTTLGSEKIHRRVGKGDDDDRRWQGDGQDNSMGKSRRYHDISRVVRGKGKDDSTEKSGRHRQ